MRAPHPLGVACLLAALTPSAAWAGRRALVVGANDGGIGLEPLQYAERDAQRIADTLTDLGGFDADAVVLLQSPSRAEIEAELWRARALAADEEGDLFLFYYSGHADAQGLRLADEALAFDALRALVEAVDADVRLGVLDACRSGAITQVKGAAIVDPFLDASLQTEGEVWITASSEDERAQESDRIQGSFFTHHLVSGLRGAADTGGDGVVTLSEAYSYAYAHTVEETQRTFAGTQTPMYDYRLSGNGDLSLTRLSDASARLTLASGFGGRILILEGTERRLAAEIDKPADRAVVLALPPGDYTLRRRADGELYEMRLHLADHGSFVVDDRWGTATQQVATAKGDAWTGTQTTAPERPDDAVDWLILGEAGEDWDIPPRLSPALARGQRAWTTASEVQWRRNPYVAASASTALAGGGQFYNGDYLKGTAYLVGTAALVGTGWGVGAVAGNGSFFSGSLTGPTPAGLLGASVWGWSITQAYGVHTGGWHRQRPITGVALASETSWWNTVGTPHAAGISADWILAPGFSIGLDRVGWSRSQVDDSGTVTAGGRLVLAKEWDHLRPGVFAATGLRADLGKDVDNPVRAVFGTGALVRYYLGPRYFIGYELRLELDSEDARVTHAGAVGVHLGG